MHTNNLTELQSRFKIAAHEETDCPDRAEPICFRTSTRRTFTIDKAPRYIMAEQSFSWFGVFVVRGKSPELHRAALTEGYEFTLDATNPVTYRVIGRACDADHQWVAELVKSAPELEIEQLRRERDDWENQTEERSHILAALLGHDEQRLREWVMKLRQSDGEGWAIGEMLDRYLQWYTGKSTTVVSKP